MHSKPHSTKTILHAEAGHDEAINRRYRKEICVSGRVESLQSGMLPDDFVPLYSRGPARTNGSSGFNTNWRKSVELAKSCVP